MMEEITSKIVTPSIVVSYKPGSEISRIYVYEENKYWYYDNVSETFNYTYTPTIKESGTNCCTFELSGDKYSLYNYLNRNSSILKNIVNDSPFYSVRLSITIISGIISDYWREYEKAETLVHLWKQPVMPNKYSLECSVIKNEFNISDDKLMNILYRLTNFCKTNIQESSYEKKYTYTLVHLKGGNTGKRITWRDYAREVLDSDKYSICISSDFIEVEICCESLTTVEQVTRNLVDAGMTLGYMKICNIVVKTLMI